jgi:hypothetical protein
MNYAPHSARNCVRCHRDLTDAASMEVGIGPVCRKLDNAVLAQTIPADAGLALVALETVNHEALAPETVNTYHEVVASLVQGANTTDWRKTVKRMEWMLSYPLTRSHAFQQMLSAVHALGYVGLAALWSGEASTGMTTVRFENGRLYVKGPQNKSARFALKSIKGWQFHGATKEWSVPATGADAFQSAVQKYYPVNTGLAEAMTSAKAHATMTAALTSLAPMQPPAPAQPKCRIESSNGALRIYTPYNANFVAALKAALPYGDRRWDAVAKCWVADAKHLNTVEALVAANYGTAPAMPVATPVPAPVPVAAPAPVVLPKFDPNALPF